MSENDLGERVVEIGQQHIRGAFNDGLRTASDVCKMMGEHLRSTPNADGEAAVCETLRDMILKLQQSA